MAQDDLKKPLVNKYQLALEWHKLLKSLEPWQTVKLDQRMVRLNSRSFSEEDIAGIEDAVRKYYKWMFLKYRILMWIKKCLGRGVR